MTGACGAAHAWGGGAGWRAALPACAPSQPGGVLASGGTSSEAQPGQWMMH